MARTEALPSSNAQLTWRTDIVAKGEPVSVPVTPRSPWRPFVSSVDFFLHRFRASAAVRRFAPTANATVRTLQDEFPVELTFRSDDDRPAAIGFEIEVDGFRLDLTLPTHADIGGDLLSARLLGASRLSYLRDRFRLDPDLPADLNPFQREWIFQMLFAIIAAHAATGGDVSTAAADLLGDDHIDATFLGAMDEFLGSGRSPAPDDEEVSEDEIDDDGEHGSVSQPQTTRAAGRLTAGHPALDRCDHPPAKINRQRSGHACRPPSPARSLNQIATRLGILAESVSSKHALTATFS